MRHTYLRVAGATVRLVKTSPGTFTGTYNVGDVTYDVTLGFDFASSTFAYDVLNADTEMSEEQWSDAGFESKTLAKEALVSVLVSLTPSESPASTREGMGELDDEGNEILAA